MTARLWYMNADFEMELAAPFGSHRRPASFDPINRRLAPLLLWLARDGDGLLLDQPWPEAVLAQARSLGVEVVSPRVAPVQSARIFTPWGWTPSAVTLGHQLGATVEPVPHATVRRVNSKLWSHALEQELGIVLAGARAAETWEELTEAVACSCPGAADKWVIKSPLGFAARARVLGRGPRLEGPAATWAKRRFINGEALLFQPWLDVIREYGVQMRVLAGGEIDILGISDLQTNGAGAATGYLLGRKVESRRADELERIATIVGGRLWEEGYVGPAGVDALEHRGGLHPLLEVNARYTTGFIALAVERKLLRHSSAPVFWSTR